MLFSACDLSGGDGTSTATPLSDLAQHGRTVYQANCIACHNNDPRKPGAIGPEIAGSSAVLIESRVMRTEYPPGYTPKRQTKQMTPLPQLKNDIPALSAYLNALK
jgi:mono/diheme cytochrome c family protein